MKNRTSAGISRRTVAKGAAWTAPVAMLAMAAPAVAASGTSCLSAVWTDAIYSGAGGKWGFDIQFANVCSPTDIKVNRIDVVTTYQAPATNTTADQVVASFAPGLTLNQGQQPTKYVHNRGAFSPPPKNTGSLLPEYYNSYPDVTGRKIPCMTTPKLPGDAGYPDCGRRLAADGTYLLVSYTIGTNAFTLPLVMGAGVGCSVVAGCAK
jgi:hypothetical protein